MKSHIFLLAALVLTTSLSKAQVSAITNVNIIDVESGNIAEGQTVVVTDDRITAIGSTGGTEVPRGAQTVDGSGKYLIPGLWDMHVHLDDPEMWPYHLERDKKEAHLRMLVAFGVTGVRDMGGGFDQVLKWKESVASGAILGPSIIAAGPIVDGDPPLWIGSAAAGTPEEGREIVQSLSRRGADFIKAYSVLDRDVFFAIVDESNRLGLPVAGHLPIRVSPIEAANAGMSSIEHAIGLTYECTSERQRFRRSMNAGQGMSGYPWGLYLGSDQRVQSTFDLQHCTDMIEAFASNQTWQVPTLRTLWGLSSRAFDDNPDLRILVDETHVRNWLENRTPDPQLADIRATTLDQNLKLVNAMHEAGVGILAGTDMAALPYTYPGFSLHKELELFVEAGMSPLSALQTATLNPAVFLRQEDAVGRVKTGLIADLVLLDGNPLTNISNTQRISGVWKSGRMILRPELDTILEEVADTMR